MPTPLSTLEDHAEFQARHIGPDAVDESLMCAAIGVSSRAALIDAVVPASAQTRRDRTAARESSRVRYDDDRSVWERSRDKITTGGGAVGGAIIGGLIGGKKGAVIGAVTGGAGAAVYTYKIRKKDDNRRY